MSQTQDPSPGKEGSGVFPFCHYLRTGSWVEAPLPVSCAAPASPPQQTLDNRKGEAVRVGISSGIMAKTWWDGQGKLRIGFLIRDLSQGHPPEIKHWLSPGRPCLRLSSVRCQGARLRPKGVSLPCLLNRSLSLPHPGLSAAPEAYRGRCVGCGCRWVVCSCTGRGLK